MDLNAKYEKLTTMFYGKFDTTVPYVDKVKSERYGAKYENGVAYLLSYIDTIT
jgi:HSP20 family molecular chaperone IbpA